MQANTWGIQPPAWWPLGWWPLGSSGPIDPGQIAHLLLEAESSSYLAMIGGYAVAIILAGSASCLLTLASEAGASFVLDGESVANLGAL